MAKHLNVNLQFTADTSQAASQIKSLQATLTGLTNGSAIGKNLPITKELMEAQQQAGRLKAVLQDSLNPKGTVDIGRFTQNFKKAGLDVNKLKSQMESLGPSGSKAFAQLAQSVATADAPLRRTSKLMTELSTTLKNTARWQLTSSMIHGFMGGLQEAYSYAQSLDKSLTNIRIVSGLGADEMARFAEQANKSAQALSTTTTKYTDAALIYYQQGLDDSAVKERTDTTIKMANVTGEGVKEVSSYMTAIWNNFNKEGDYSADHFADIMTKLGAETAASTDEIAAGLSKFSAVADTVGLSFEMASSAVTAVVDQTRESPEVVGTAMKTIFSRIEGLKMGETLEDGVDLNKYSQTLAKFGINIMDASGELRDMDSILHDIGDTWETLGRKEQVALAQNVAGIRQYNQFMAIFDNWGNVEQNLERAANAGGTLQEQADTYAESWEAAKNRVTAAAQAIYADLLDDDFFKGVLNTIAGVLKGVDGLIDGMGGLSGVIGTLGVVFTRVFEKQMLAGISSMAYNIQQMTKKGKAENETTRKDFTTAWKETGALGDTHEGQAQKKAIEQQATAQEALHAAAKTLTEEEVRRLQVDMDVNKALNERLVLMARELDMLDQEKNKKGQDLKNTVAGLGVTGEDRAQDANQRKTNNKAYQTAVGQATADMNKTANVISAIGKTEGIERQIKATDTLIKKLNQAGGSYADVAADLAHLKDQYDKGAISAEEFGAAMQKYATSDGLQNSMASDATFNFMNKLQEQGVKIDPKDFDKVKAAAQGYFDTYAKGVVEQKKYNQSAQKVSEKNQQMIQSIQNAKTAFSTLGTNIVNAAQRISSATMAFSALHGAWNALNNEDMGFFEKFLSVTMSLTMAISGLSGAFEGLTVAKIKDGVASVKNAISTGIEALAQLGLAEATEEVVEAKGAEAILDATSQGGKEAVEDLAEAAANVAKAEAIEEVNKEKAKEALLDKFSGNNLKAGLGKAGNVAKGLVKLLGKLPGPVKIAAVAAVALAGAFALAQKEANRNEQALADATTALQNQKEALAELEQKHEEMGSAIEAYEEAYNAINQAKKGTEEWADAIALSNEKAKELIETYGLFGKWHYDENGAIVIDEDAAQEAYDQQEQEVRQAEARVATSELVVNQAEWEVVKEDSAFDTSMHYQGDGNMQVDSNKESNMQALAGLSDEAYMEIKNLSQLTGEEYTKALEQISTTFGMSTGEIENLVDVIQGLGTDADATRDKVVQLAEAEQYYRAQIGANVAASNNYFGDNELANQAYGNLMAQNEDFTNQTDHISDVASGNVNNTDIKGMLRDRDEDIGLTLSDKELAQMYGKYVKGMSDEELSQTTYDKGNGKGTLKDSEGNVIFELDDEQMRKEIYTALATDNLVNNKDEKGNEVYNDQEVKDLINGIVDNTNISTQTQDAVLSAVANYDTESGELDLDTSLIPPEDIEELKNDVKNWPAGVQAAMQEKLDNYDWKEYRDKADEMQVQQLDNTVAAEELDSTAIDRQTDLIQENTEALADNESAAKQLAINNSLMNRGMETLSDNWDDWSKVLKTGDKTASDYAETIADMTPCIEDLVGLSNGMGENLSSDFFDSAENIELLEEAANGSAEAVEKLGYAVARDLVDNMDFDESALTETFDLMKANAEEAGKAFEGIKIGDEFITSADQMRTKFDEAKSGVLSAINQIETAGLSVGDPLSDAINVENFVNDLNTMAIATGMSVEQMQGMLSSMGVEATVTTTSVPTTHNVPRMRTEEEIINDGSDGNPIVKETKTWQVGTDKEEGYMDVAQIAYDGSNPGATPITKIGHGSSSSSNRSRGSSGSRRSSSRRRERQKIGKKDLQDETERYHVINNKLDDMEAKLDRIGRAKDRAFGKNKIKLMNDEIKALEKDIELQEKYADEVEKNLKKDRTKLAGDKTTGKKGVVQEELGMDVKFDANGTITNYDAIVKANVDKYNDRRDYYNSLSASKQEELDNKYKEMTNPETGEKYSGYEDYMQAEYDKVKTAIEQYEETQELWEDANADLEEKRNALLDAKLEKTDYIVQLKLDVTADDQKILDFLMERIDGDAWRAAEQINIHDQNIQNSEANIEASKEGLRGIFANHEGLDEDAIMEKLAAGDFEGAMNLLGDEEFTEAEIEKMREYSDNILNETAKIKEEQKAVIDLTGDVIDAHIEAFDNVGNSISHASDVLSAYGEIIDLVGQDELGLAEDAMRQMEDTSQALLASATQNSKNKFEQLKTELAGVEAELEAARASGDAEIIKQWEDTVQNTKEKMQDAESEWMAAWTAELEAAQQVFDQRMQRSIKTFEKAVAGSAGSLEGLSAQMDLYAMTDDNYVQDYERIYELNKLNREINESIDNTSNVRAKEALLELEDKINQQKESGNKMSEYQIEQLRKQYELKMAEIALEEAQNSKSQVRMTKDSEGNFSYVYTADEDAVEDAEQAYEDKLKEYQELNYNHIKEIESQLVETQQNYAQAMAAAAEMYGYGTDEYTQAVALIQQKYSEEMTYLHDELELTMQDNQRLHTEDVASYAKSVGDTQMLNTSYIGSFDQTTYSMVTGYSDRNVAEQAWQSASSALFTQAGIDMQAYGTTVTSTMTENTGATSSFGEAVSSAITSIAEVSSTLAEDVTSTLTTVQDSWDETINKVSSFSSVYNEKLASLSSTNAKFVDTMNQVLEKWAEVEEQSTTTTTTTTTTTRRTGGTPTRPRRNRFRAGDIIGFTGRYHENSYGGGRSGSQNAGRARAVKISSFSLDPYGYQRNGGRYKIHIETKSGGHLGWIKPDQAFDTGGYTGKWGSSEGRIAMLHQKEIVLNASDTENFLKTVEIVRQISQTIDLNALSSMGAMSSGLHSAGVGSQTQDLQQQVHITAEFPNATNKDEIIKAFDNVINLAAQYAGKRR